jgi:CRISPR system Cascade subunit CasA
MSEFNLLDQAWIPCLMQTGNRPRELSLRDVLTEAHNIREVFDDSPLVTVALHRLLLAILHRNFGPARFSEWKELWKRGQWDGEALTSYFAQWRHRFDLFDEARPFFQVPRLQKASASKKAGKKEAMAEVEREAVELQPAAKLAHEAAAGNNATLFDHSFKDAAIAFSPAAAARYLIACQAFSIGFGISHLHHSPNGKQTISFNDALLTRGLSVLALGRNLFETLALNLLIYTEERPIPWQGNDLPAWEQEAPFQPDEYSRTASGYLDYLTWPSRRIHLIAEGDPPLVRHCQFQQNLSLANSAAALDPFQCYREVKEKGLKPIPLNPAKALWRDSHTLFQPTEQSKRRPEVFNFLARVESARRRGEIEAQPAYSFAAYGFATKIGQAANVEFWARERLPLPLVYLTEAYLVESLRLALKLADDVCDGLNESICLLARLLIAPLSNDKNARQPDANDVTNVASGFAAEEFYWARLDPAFKKLLTDLPEDQRANQAAEDLPDTRAATEWAHMLLDTARDALNKTINSLSGSARELKAAAEAERRFNGLMKQIREAHPRLFPPKPETGGNA